MDRTISNSITSKFTTLVADELLDTINEFMLKNCSWVSVGLPTNFLELTNGQDHT